jgi:hypothetical protein
MTQLRRQISSDIQDLNKLHQEYWWIPDETMVRPSAEVLEAKWALAQRLIDDGVSFKDFIMRMYFTGPWAGAWVFDKSLFPYRLPIGGEHFVLWNSMHDYNWDVHEVMVSERIECMLKVQLGHNRFDFAWYKNPKPSIPELWHVQVFWIAA